MVEASRGHLPAYIIGGATLGLVAAYLYIWSVSGYAPGGGGAVGGDGDWGLLGVVLLGGPAMFVGAALGALLRFARARLR